MIVAVLTTYLGLVLAVGLFGHRMFRGTGEDYFLASRSIGPFVLVMTLFGTNMTAFTMLGASGEAYNRGIIVFALMASSSAILIPFQFFYMGTESWKLGKRHGYLTQVQLVRGRFGSDLVGLLLFIVVVALMLPYILIGVKGGGGALSAVTSGPNALPGWLAGLFSGASGEPAQGLPQWVGSLLVCTVTFVYVTYGGMRSTAWVNTLQTTVFVIFGFAASSIILSHYGGLGSAMVRLREEQPQLVSIGLNRATILQMCSFLMLPLCTAAFPHLYSHWLSARSARSLRPAIIYYPVLIAAVWFPMVALGAIGRLDFPEPPGGPILVRLLVEHTGDFVTGCLAAGVFAAIMSSLDSQILALGAMFTQDIVRHYGIFGQLSEKQQVWSGRLFVMAFLALAFVCSLFADQSIFALGTWALTGFAGLFPLFVATLFWPRATAGGAAASILTTIGLWVWFFAKSLGVEGPYSIGGTGLKPVAVIVPAAAIILVAVSIVTSPREQ